MNPGLKDIAQGKLFTIATFALRYDDEVAPPARYAARKTRRYTCCQRNSVDVNYVRSICEPSISIIQSFFSVLEVEHGTFVLLNVN